MEKWNKYPLYALEKRKKMADYPFEKRIGIAYMPIYEQFTREGKGMISVRRIQERIIRYGERGAVVLLMGKYS